MTRAARIRKWLTDNPGWHFGSDICAALGVDGKDRLRCLQQLRRLGEEGVLETTGTHGTKRYLLAHQARQLITGEFS